MIINGEKFPLLSVFPSMMTVPDCVVTTSNKIGQGHGEAKFYIASKEDMYSFYGCERFQAKCFMRKTDLVAYMLAIKNEYLTPSQEYAKKDMLPQLWEQRMQMVQALDDLVFFTIYDQFQISGPRGYINSDDAGYRIIRKIALPLVSYIYVEKLGTEDSPLFYWKLFVDFDAINQRQNSPLVFTYGKSKASTSVSLPAQPKEPDSSESKKARIGQGKYREQLLEQCHFCPFTKISDERLLIASHIKPWAACNKAEKVDPFNGYALSPLYDRLFDQGFITFTEKRHVILSDFISPYTWKRIGLKNDTFLASLPMDEHRIEYLKFHHKAVFKGVYSENDL